MRLYSYVVARDYGFAPNPFHGVCTLATCKPLIRKTAAVGDWIIGTGSATRGKVGKLVFAMRVGESLTFDQYWEDPRFAAKRPTLNGSVKQAFGDNIYHHSDDGTWLQENSHHSYPDGTSNQYNIAHDTGADRVLISDDFVYFGSTGPVIPARFRDFDGIDICAGRGHKCAFPQELVQRFVGWLEKRPRGYSGEPLEWRNIPLTQ